MPSWYTHRYLHTLDSKNHYTSSYFYLILLHHVIWFSFRFYISIFEVAEINWFRIMKFTYNIIGKSLEHEYRQKNKLITYDYHSDLKAYKNIYKVLTISVDARFNGRSRKEINVHSWPKISFMFFRLLEMLLLRKIEKTCFSVHFHKSQFDHLDAFLRLQNYFI